MAMPKSQGWEKGHSQPFQLKELQSYRERGMDKGRNKANNLSHMENNPVTFPPYHTINKNSNYVKDLSIKNRVKSSVQTQIYMRLSPV